MPNAALVPVLCPYHAAANINRPAAKWQKPSNRCAGIHRSATMPIRAGMKIETMPCMAKKGPIWEAIPMLLK